MIRFQTIRWKNFLGVGDYFVEMTLNTHVNTLIVGDNGAGKSTILDALTFVLFGKSYRGINKPLLVNSTNKKNCVVEIEFTTNNKKYKIVRGIKPNVFEIYCDGTCINQDSTTKDYQEYLERFILKMNYKSFTQIVILGSASFTPFMKLTPADRRAIIEDLLDIEIFSTMSDIVKKKVYQNKDAIELNRVTVQSKQDQKSFVERTLDSLRKTNSEKVLEIQDSIKTNKDTIKTLEDEIVALLKEESDLNKQASGLSKLKQKHSSLVSLQAKIDTNKDRIEKDNDFFKSNDTCPTCRQNIDEQFKTDSITKNAAKISEYDEAISQLTNNLNDVVSQINQIDKLLVKASAIRTQAASRNSKIQVLKKQNKDLEDNANKIKNSDKLIQENELELLDLQKSLVDLLEQKQELAEEKIKLDTASMILKDGGVKTKIIKKYLPVINKMINKFLMQMGYTISFNIDENFNETIKSRYRDEFTYHSFSEGQKARINLAILFAWREVARIKNSVNTNLLIFDEIFDSSLDANGTEDFVKLMYSLVQNTHVLVISHKQDQFSDKFKRVMTFKMTNGFSQISSKDQVK